jgi:hypothetical protein
MGAQQSSNTLIWKLYYWRFIPIGIIDNEASVYIELPNIVIDRYTKYASELLVDGTGNSCIIGTILINILSVKRADANSMLSGFTCKFTSFVAGTNAGAMLLKLFLHRKFRNYGYIKGGDFVVF